MRRGPSAAALVAALACAGCAGPTAPRVAEVSVKTVGATGFSFETTARVPSPVGTSCSPALAIVTSTLGDGKRIVYGPACLPPSIDGLARRLLRAVLARRAPKRPRPAGRDEWRTVLQQWEAGTLAQHWHPCGAVRDALRHLPTDPPVFSTVRGDLELYAGAVC